MIFDFRLLRDISDVEIKDLVNNHITEKQNLEYKLTVDYKNQDSRLEILCDIASLANSGGGYLIIGIRDDGKGRAQKFESVDNPVPMIKSIRHLALDHIVERIEDLDFELRTIDGKNVILIRVPSSNRTPHMVTFNNNTHFVTRYNDGKREMTLGEIKSSFTDDLIGRRLSFIEENIKYLTGNLQESTGEKLKQKIDNGNISALNVNDGNIIAAHFKEKIEREFIGVPKFYISITPIHCSLGLIDFSNGKLLEIFNNPPDDRYAGWNMNHFSTTSKRNTESIYKDADNLGLSLFQNGHMHFYAFLDKTFSWTQTPEEFKKQPKLYPYPLSEYPVSFLRLYKHIIRLMNLTGDFIITVNYSNVRGYALSPYHPKSLPYNYIPIESFTTDKILIPNITVNETYEPDEKAFDILKYVYASFGFKEELIPFYDRENKKFRYDD